MLKRGLLIAAAVLVAAPVFAEDFPDHDPMLERIMIERLQPKLPELRPTFGIHERARLVHAAVQHKPTGLHALAEEAEPAYYGHISWL
ncbi:hypothetical protein [Rhizobium sp. NRK18]|uniref:hypothetical protein n=1 Tax=Rhizobium sp. NRK18 TaxID=2964667 RepID=UPI0021C2FC9E|nr:hypothetical protein [Rhizobium sp. NRK18]MCQ2005106.1 hypothetical protein [Rhizobium sp. NRK18]